MAEIDNQPVKSYRDQLHERMSSRYPDRNFDAAGGENGANGESGSEILDQAILEAIDGFQAREDEYRAKNDALKKLFYSDPRSAEFVNEWVRSGDPRAALVSTFGDELSELATEEGRGRFSEGLKTWRERKAENDTMEQEAEANWSKSLEDLDAWGNEKGLDNDQKAQVMIRLVGVAANGLMNKYEPADFDMAWKEMKYEEAIQIARREGEVAGRNARIEENKMRRQSVGAMPPALSGQGMAVREREKTPRSIWADIK